MKRFVKNVALVLLVWLLFIILCLVIPPAFHKRATPEDWLNDIRYEHTAPERVRSIDDNSDALLWRLRLIEEAKERIILTTFDFWDEESGQDVIGALWAGSLALLHRFGSSAADDRFLLGRLDFPVRSLLPAGTDAMVLAHGTLHPPGRTRHACFRQAKLDGSRYGRHTAGIHRAE